MGDPVTLKMSVGGEGNLSSIIMPALKADSRFKVYDPQIKEENGKKILEQVIMPKTDQMTEIPAIHFSYFDPDKKEYQSIVQGPFSLQVKKTENKDEFKVVGFDQTAKTSASIPPVSEEIGQDILFIKDQPGHFRSSLARLDRNPFFILAWVLVSLLWVGLAFFYNWKKRIQTDVVYARRLRAPKKARDGIEAAQKFLKADKQKNFYDTLHKTLQEYLGDKFHFPAAGVTPEVLEKKIKDHRMNEDILKKVRIIFDECEMVRYASVNLAQNKMGEDLKILQEIIDYLERNLK